MPAATKKPLYISDSVGGLNDYVDNDVQSMKKTSCKMLQKSADRLFLEASESFRAGDEERSYILFMRFCNVIESLKNTADFQRDKKYYLDLTNKKMLKALENAETLQKSLYKRYEHAREEDEVRVMLEQKESEKKLKENNKAQEKKVVFDGDIKPEEFYKLMRGNEAILLIDIRSAEDFIASHVEFANCINVPQQLLSPGITAESLRSKLPSNSQVKWAKRSSFEYIVLMDRNSKNVNSSPKLNILTDAMCKWDPGTKLKHKPLVLEGGFEEWVLYYPAVVTSPVHLTNNHHSSQPVPSILNLEYPDLDALDKPLTPTQPKAPEPKTVPPVQNNGIPTETFKALKPAEIAKPIVPVIDRTAKPATAITPPVEPPNEPEKAVPEVRRELKPKDVNKTAEEEAKDDEIAAKVLEEEKLRLLEENDKMKAELENISKESEQRKLQEKLTQDELDNVIREKNELENKIQTEKKRSHELEARMHRKPEDKPKTTSAVMPQKNDVKTTKLKSEENKTPLKSSGGLSRSHSSPNIAQLLADEESALKPFPKYDRTTKPANKPSDMFKLNSSQILNVNAARQRNLMPIYGCQGSGLTGLKNLGNTCFMNSVLQCLTHTVHLCHYFIGGNFRPHINRQNKKGTRGNLSEEFSVLVKSIWSNQYRSISPKDFKEKAAKYIDVCVGYDQQDSHEFLTIFMDKLHQDVNTATVVGKVKAPDMDNMLQSEAVESFWRHHKLFNQSVISELFEGLMCSTLQCLSCSKKSFSFEEFMCLSLPIPSSSNCSLQDCLTQFFKTERMTGEGRWSCPSCKCRQEAEKKIDICKLPKILIIHLKRFSYDGMWRRKLQTYVDFPFDLNITTFIPGPDSRQKYALYGVSNHYGTLEGGHYTAYCKTLEINRWHKFDDHEVSDVSSNLVKTSAAYILFYSSLDQNLPAIKAL